MSSLRKNFFLTVGFFVIGTGVLIGIFWYLLVGLFYPIADKFSSSQQDIANYERDSRYHRIVIIQDLAESDSYLNQIKNMFYSPSRENGFKMILFFEDAAKRNEVKASIAQPPETAPQVDVQVMGKFNNILKFLRELENSAYLLSVNRFSISSGGGGGMYSATISLTLNSQ